MKKFLTVAVAMMVMFSIAGCDGTADKKPAAGAAKDTGKKAEITFVIPSNAGGGNDLTTRAMISSLEKSLGVTIVPLNQGESGGAVAASTLMKAKADGTVLYFNSQTLLTTALTTVKSIKLDQFQPVAQIIEDTGIIFGKKGRWNTIQEFATEAKKGELIAATNGKTALWGVAASKLAQALGTKFEYVSYNGGAPMLTALAAGEADLAIVNPAEAASLVAAGKIVPLAVMSDKRLDNDALKNIPTCKETGINVTYAVWRGVFTKAGTSEEVMNKLDKAFAEAVKSQEFVDYAKKASLPIHYLDHKDFTKFINDEIGFYKKEFATK